MPGTVEPWNAATCFIASASFICAVLGSYPSLPIRACPDVERFMSTHVQSPVEPQKKPTSLNEYEVLPTKVSSAEDVESTKQTVAETTVHETGANKPSNANASIYSGNREGKQQTDLRPHDPPDVFPNVPESRVEHPGEVSSFAAPTTPTKEPLQRDLDLDSRPPSAQPAASPIRVSRNPASISHHPQSQESFESGPQASTAARMTTGGPDRVDDGTDFSKNSEILSIMDQFKDEEHGPKEEEIMSPRRELAGPTLSTPMQFPPRRSSLEPLSSSHERPTLQSDEYPPYNSAHTRDSSQFQDGFNNTTQKRSISDRSPQTFSEHHQPPEARATVSSPKSTSSLSGAPIPQPDPESDLPFDFHRFLEQLRHRTADPVAGFLRSFLTEFGKKQWMVHEQVKIIGDFLSFITNKMAQCEIWQGVSDAEFDNAREGMEKLVMNRLYAQTFSPAIPPAPAVQVGKGKRKNMDRMLGGTRRGQHQEDIERDEILAEKVRIYGWIQETHLDIPFVADNGKRFLVLAQQELLKITNYRAPRDKVICVLNCCKVIFGLLRSAKSSDTSADSFIPLLIYVILKANPEHLVSNIQYIFRFRNQDKLGGEAGYYLSSLMGAIQFIENLDRTSLTISDQDFEHNVELAVSAITERHKDQTPQRNGPAQISEKSGLSVPEVTPRNSLDAERSLPRHADSAHLSKERPPVIRSDGDSNPVTGILRNIQKPLSNISRIFSDQPPPNHKFREDPRIIPPDPPPRRLSPAMFHPPRESEEEERPESGLRQPEVSRKQPSRILAEDAAARQASAEAAEAQRIQAAEHNNVVE